MANLKTILLNLEIKRTELLRPYEPSYPLVQEVEKAKLLRLSPQSLMPKPGQFTRKRPIRSDS